jgi:hypothetical protein
MLDDLTISEIAALAVQDENTGTVPERAQVIAAKAALGELARDGDVIGIASSHYQHLLDERARMALAAGGARPMHVAVGS